MVQECMTQGLIILFGILYNLPHCDVVYGAISVPKPSLFRWLEFVESLGKTIRDDFLKQLMDEA